MSTVPNSDITGDVGVSPIAQGALTGFSLTLDSSGKFATSTQVTGKMYAADFAATTPAKMTQAVSDMEAAYIDAAGRSNPDHVEYKAGVLGGAILAPGLYKFSTAVGIGKDLTLLGSATDTWIFQIAGGLSIAADTNIVLEGGASANNVVWVTAGVNSFGARSHFEGTILGATSASFITGSSINGRVLVQTAVTLQMTTVTKPSS